MRVECLWPLARAVEGAVESGRGVGAFGGLEEQGAVHTGDGGGAGPNMGVVYLNDSGERVCAGTTESKADGSCEMGGSAQARSAPRRVPSHWQSDCFRNGTTLAHRLAASPSITLYRSHRLPLTQLFDTHHLPRIGPGARLPSSSHSSPNTRPACAARPLHVSALIRLVA